MSRKRFVRWKADGTLDTRFKANREREVAKREAGRSDGDGAEETPFHPPLHPVPSAGVQRELRRVVSTRSSWRNEKSHPTAGCRGVWYASQSVSH
jgi:hypothetical protein